MVCATLHVQGWCTSGSDKSPESWTNRWNIAVYLLDLPWQTDMASLDTQTSSTEWITTFIGRWSCKGAEGFYIPGDRWVQQNSWKGKSSATFVLGIDLSILEGVCFYDRDSSDWRAIFWPYLWLYLKVEHQVTLILVRPVGINQILRWASEVCVIMNS